MSYNSKHLEFIYDQEIYHTTSKPSLVFRTYKRAADIITSLILLPILALICFITLLLNPFFNRGKLFYSQPRVGKGNKVFQIYKLRTMQNDPDCDSQKSATEQGARITSFGQLMRDIHIDELPQVINVLLGNMSLIGPRPEQPELFQRYAQSIQGFAMRQSVRPGISGLAQIHEGHTDCEAGARKKLKWDLDYIQRQEFRFEGQIYFMTCSYISSRIARHLLALIRTSKSRWPKLYTFYFDIYYSWKPLALRTIY